MAFLEVGAYGVLWGLEAEGSFGQLCPVLALTVLGISGAHRGSGARSAFFGELPSANSASRTKHRGSWAVTRTIFKVWYL